MSGTTEVKTVKSYNSRLSKETTLRYLSYTQPSPKKALFGLKTPFSMGTYQPLISLREIHETRTQIDHLLEIYQVPEIQRLRLDGRAEYVAFGNCALQRTVYAYRSKKYANEQGLKTRIRYARHKDVSPRRMRNLEVDHGSHLWVTVKCALCGHQKRIKITERNQGREEPICAKCHKQRYFIPTNGIKRVNR